MQSVTQYSGSVMRCSGGVTLYCTDMMHCVAGNQTCRSRIVYVALSRAVSLSMICVKGLQMHNVKVDEDALATS